MSGDSYPTTAMLIWDDSMPKPAISLAFAAETAGPGQQCRAQDKAVLWHHCLGHASHDATLHTRTVTLTHDIPSSSPTSDTLCNICVQSKATTRTLTHPRHVEAPLELVLMDVMGPLHGATKFTYVLIIHDAYSSMIWTQGLASKSQASQEAAWWFAEICVATCQVPSEVVFNHGLKEVCINQGELWSNAFHNLCLLMGIKVTAAPTQQHLDNAFTEWAIQTIQKIAQSILYDANLNKCWWPYAISQAAFIHNQLAGATCRNLTPFELFYEKHPELHQLWHFGCITYVVLWGNTRLKWLLCNHLVASKHLRPCTLHGTYLGFSDTPCTVKGHQVWLPELNCIVITKDIQFSKLKQSETDTNPSHPPVLTGNAELLCSYTWIPRDDDPTEMGSNDDMPPLLMPYSQQHGDTP